MAGYLETKKMLLELIGFAERVDNDGSEELSIRYILNDRHGERYTYEEKKCIITDKLIRDAYEEMRTCQFDGLQMLSENSYEVAIDWRWFRFEDEKKIEDNVNEINYYMGHASLPYILFICNQYCNDKTPRKDILRALRIIPSRIHSQKELTTDELISRLFRIKTLRITTKKSTKPIDFERFSCSFEYLYMYKTKHSIMKILDLSSLYERGGIGRRSREMRFEEPPRRTVNQETLEYYAMAIDSEDPFTAYISFYHVLEYYFDEVYKKKLIDEMKNKLTDPGFSYKNEKKLYDLARWVGQKMKNDDADGKGNEFESLKYVLEEYVPINELMFALDEWDSNLKDYYANTNVYFSGCKKDKIGWNDTIGVYTNLANRIYNTRNSLVHSKSEQRDKLYKPLKHKTYLAKELPLIQVIAELIIFKNGSAL